MLSLEGLRHRLERHRYGATADSKSKEIDAVADDGFFDNDVSAMRDNARQPKCFLAVIRSLVNFSRMKGSLGTISDPDALPR
jgi:hypothetical protein